ncbi:hypothetical protein Tco_0267607 [Tanacetum coccineum]
MNPIASQQAALDNSLVTPEKRLKIKRCNARIAFTKLQKEETYQVTLDALKLSLCYPAFQITAEVPEIYMHQFWNTIKKIEKTDAYDFKLDKKKCQVDIEVFREILQICPRLPNQDFVELPSKDDLLSFIKELGYSGKCLFGKSTGLDRLKESRAQILWAMYNQKNIDYVALPWEDFMYQANNREISSARKERMPYPRFTKVIIDHFISKDNTISNRNRINLHTVRDDTLLDTLKFVSKTEDCQMYGAVIPDGMINDDIKLSKAYKTYLDYATGKVPPKKERKFKKPASPKLKTVPASPKEPTQKGKRVKRSAKKSTTVPTTSVVIRDTPVKSVSKNKAPAKIGRGKCIELLSDAALLKDAQMKKALKKKVPDEQTNKPKDTNEGTGKKPGVLDVFKDDFTDSEAESLGDSEDESDDVNDEDDDDNDDNRDNDNNDDNDDGGNNDGSNEDDYKENPSFTLEDYEEEEQDEEYVYSPKKDKFNDEEKMYKEEDDDVEKKLYGDLNITQGLRDTYMANAEQGGEDQQNASHEFGFVQEEDDGHVTLTTVYDKTEGTMHSLSVSSDFTSKLLNLDNTSPDVNEIASLMNTLTVPLSPPPFSPSSHLTTTLQQQTPDSTTTTTNPTITLL